MDDIAVVTPLPEGDFPNSKWVPKAGPEIEKLFGKLQLPRDAKDKLLNASVSILSRGISPQSYNGYATGLVVGYVQSGKTLSFTTTIALARDNGFQLVIVIAGTSIALFDQSDKRLRAHLSIGHEDGGLRWIVHKNPVNDSECRRNVQQTLDEWHNPDVPESERATVLMTVMKNHKRMDNLVGLLDTLNLGGKLALIIDDEADQASLNTKVQQDRKSVTYRQLLNLRGAVPNHTFLQYTATPQAPLLINIIDALSPQFVEVLESGDDYVGGKEFFCGSSNLVKVIPDHDIPSSKSQSKDFPQSLLEALRFFLVGVAVWLKQGRGNGKPPHSRSMLVHPSQRKEQHRIYYERIRNVLNHWHTILQLPEANRDRKDLIESFQKAYDELSKTVSDLMPFEEISPMLNRALTKTRITEINTRSGPTPLVEWDQAYGWILVGGQAMDRGYTVEGLTVTYMPRGRGVGNVDAIQQRARFFGYKRSYLGFCRVYLEQEIRIAFEHYVAHEEYMRDQLKKFSEGTKPLKDWKRIFVLAPTLKPCRKEVIQYRYVQGRYADAWFFPKMLYTPNEVTDENRKVLEDFAKNLIFEQDLSYDSSFEAQQHLVCRGVRLSRLLEQLFLVYRIIDASDTQEMMGFLLQLSEALDRDRDDTATVYLMRPNYRGKREVDTKGRVSSIRRLLQGQTKIKGKVTYPGDVEFRDKEHLSVQIHYYDLIQDKRLLESNVPAIAAWVPSRMRLDWLVQNQEVQEG